MKRHFRRKKTPVKAPQLFCKYHYIPSSYSGGRKLNLTDLWFVGIKLISSPRVFSLYIHGSIYNHFIGMVELIDLNKNRSPFEKVIEVASQMIKVTSVLVNPLVLLHVFVDHFDLCNLQITNDVHCYRHPPPKHPLSIHYCHSEFRALPSLRPQCVSLSQIRSSCLCIITYTQDQFCSAVSGPVWQIISYSTELTSNTSLHIEMNTYILLKLMAILNGFPLQKHRFVEVDMQLGALAIVKEFLLNRFVDPILLCLINCILP